MSAEAPFEAPSLTTEWARFVVECLVGAGIKELFVSPGSRSTPLLMQALKNGSLRLHSVIDERAAGFAALGYARATGKVAAVLCTSGTAPSHFYPAVVEAHHSGHGMVLLTADRARREQDLGAAQTTNQTKMFGEFAHFVELGDPTPTPQAFRAIRRKLDSAMLELRHVRRALQVNVPFDKPLEPTEGKSGPELALRRAANELLRDAISSPNPSVSSSLGLLEIHELDGCFEAAERPVVLLGPGSRELGSTAEEWSKRTGVPLLGEAASNCAGALPAEFALDSLRESPDFLLCVGPALTSSRVHNWLTQYSGKAATLASTLRTEPALAATHRFVARPQSFFEQSTLPQRSWTAGHASTRDDVARVVQAAVAKGLSGVASPSELVFVRRALESLPREVDLLLGNSLSVRLADWVRAGLEAKFPTVHVQRGVSGIDGLVAGAQGARFGVDRASVVLLGDVSFAHDLTSLGLFRDSPVPLVILLLDNEGGHLFDHLPARRVVPSEEDWSFFSTPPCIDFELIARGFGVAYEEPALASLSEAIEAALARNGTTLLRMVATSNGTSEFLATVREYLR